MGASPFGYVEGSELSQEQLTAHLASMPPLVEKLYRCAYCGDARLQPKQETRCINCGATELVSD